MFITAFLFTMFLALVFGEVPLAKTTVVHEVSYEALKSVVDRASPGDVVILPRGRFYYSEVLSVPGSITIKGEGEGKTRFVRKGRSKRAMIEVDCSNGGKFRLSGVSMVGTCDKNVADKGIQLSRSCKDFRIDSSSFSKFGRAAITVRGASSRGVIHNNKFTNNHKENLGYGIEVIGGGTYPNLALGTPHAVFIEDNVFSGNRHAVASNNGSRYVFRHNRVSECRENASCIDVHGLESWTRGSRSYEIYNNQVTNSVRRWAGIGIRGGDGVVFGNTISGVGHAVYIWNGHTGKGFGSKCDYPCKDQIRRLHIWENKHGTNTKELTVKSGYEKLLRKDRDYFLSRPDGYEPYRYPHPLRSASEEDDQAKKTEFKLPPMFVQMINEIDTGEIVKMIESSYMVRIRSAQVEIAAKQAQIKKMTMDMGVASSRSQSFFKEMGTMDMMTQSRISGMIESPYRERIKQAEYEVNQRKSDVERMKADMAAAVESVQKHDSIKNIELIQNYVRIKSGSN